MDSANGSEIQRRGYPTPLPLWSAEILFKNPKAIANIHLDYIRAGADIITTNTFRTQEYTLAKVGLAHEAERINTLAVQLAVLAREKAAVTRPIYIAGSMTALENCYRPDLVPDNATLVREHTKQASVLGQTEIDFFLLETFNTVREATIAAEAVKAVTDKPFAVSFTVDSNGRIRSGESWK